MDKETRQRLLDSVLRERGFEPELYSSGEEAWAAAQQRSFPLAVLDWKLPDISLGNATVWPSGVTECFLRSSDSARCSPASCSWR